MKVITKNNRIKVIVNGRETEVYDNLTILQALLQEGIHIPHLCYDMRGGGRRRRTKKGC